MDMLLGPVVRIVSQNNVISVAVATPIIFSEGANAIDPTGSDPRSGQNDDSLVAQRLANAASQVKIAIFV